jgi:integrase
MAPKVTGSMQTLPEDDLARLLTACDIRTWHGMRDYAIVTVLFDTGLRRGELLGMRLTDVEALFVRIWKSRKSERYFVW